METNQTAEVNAAPAAPDVASLLPWSEPKRVETKHGPRLLRKSAVTPSFWNAWRDHKEALRSAGISCGKDQRTGQFEALWWEKPADADAVMAKRQENIVASRATDASVEIPSPEGLEFLPFQKAGVAFASSKPAVLIADEMGLGKTIQAIGVINSDSTVKKVLVICPASLKTNWQREMNKWFVRPLTIGIADAKTLPETDVVVINYDVLHKHKAALDSIAWDIIVADEIHYAKNPTARRTQMIVGKVVKQERGYRGPVVWEVQPLKAVRRLFMTGTPIVNRPKELFPLLNALDPVAWPSFFKYALKYCAATQTQHGWDFSGASNLDDLQNKLRASLMVRRLKKDVLTELPPKRRQVIELPANGAAKAIDNEQTAWKRHEDTIEQLQAKVELAKASDNSDDYQKAVEALREGMRVAFTEISKVRHDTAVAKIPYMLEHIENVIGDDEGAKLVFFAHHHDVIDAISEKLGDKCVVLTGETPLAARQVAVDRFQKDPTVQVFVGSITAAGVGITLTAAAHVCFGELDWVPGNVTQAEDRCHRIGQKESVLVQHLVLEGSLDANMARTLVEKQTVIDQALDKIQSTEVATPSRRPSATRDMRREFIDRVAAKLTGEHCNIIHAGLRELAGKDSDFAMLRNDIGYSGCDVRIGHALSDQPSISKRQAALGLKLVNKYRRQIPHIVEQLDGVIQLVQAAKNKDAE